MGRLPQSFREARRVAWQWALLLLGKKKSMGLKDSESRYRHVVMDGACREEAAMLAMMAGLRLA